MKRFKNILYVVENNVTQHLSLERAVRLAEANQAQLTVIDVIPRLAMSIKMQAGDVLDKLMVKQHQDYVQTLIEPYSTRLTISTG